MKSDLEKIYKENLSNHKQPVRPELWERISQKLDQKRDKDNLILLILALVILAVLSFALLYFTVTKSSNTGIIENKTVMTFTQDPITDRNGQIEKGQSYNINNEVQKDELVTSTFSSLGSLRNSKAKKTELDNDFERPDFSKKNKSAFPNSSQELTPNSELSSTADKHSSREHIDVKDIKTKNKELQLVRNPKQIVNKSLVQNASQIKKQKSSRSTSTLDDCFPKNVKSWFTEFYVKPESSQKRITGENPSLIELRYNTERPMLSYSTGLLIGFLYKGFSVKSGIDYEQINEQFNMVIKNVISTKTVITIDTKINPDGTIITTRDTTIQEIVGENDIKKNNTFRSVNIPLLLGYYMNFNQHTILFNAGLTFNTYFNPHGTLATSSMNTVLFDGRDNKVFKNNIGISINAGVEYSFRLNKGLFFYTGPQFKVNLKSITNQEYELKQRYRLLGFSLGLRYFFY